MGRRWTDHDERKWGAAIQAACTAASAPVIPDDLSLRDLVTGTLKYVMAALLHRLGLAAPPNRSIAAEIQAASDARAVADWIAEPLEEPPAVIEVAKVTGE